MTYVVCFGLVWGNLLKARIRHCIYGKPCVKSKMATQLEPL